MELSLPPAPSFVPPESKPARKGERADSAAGVFQKDEPIHTYAEEELLLVPSDESNPASEYSTAYSSPAYLTACSSMDTSAYPSCDSSRANSPRSQEKVYTFSNGAKYVGAMLNGKMHGFGSYEDPSGIKYSGEWNEGKQHGEGVCETKDGERYCGAYLNGLPHGKGTYRYKNGNIYEGDYSEGKICGHGIIRFFDKRTFEGEFKDNKKNGHGRYEGANGVYEGNYMDGKKSGQGTFTWIDGSRYVGGWDNDLMHTVDGIKVEKDGRAFKVSYNKGKLTSAVECVCVV